MAAGTGGGVELTRGTLALTGAEWACGAGGGDEGGTLTSGAPSTSSIS
jgi:hypothetical protein